VSGGQSSTMDIEPLGIERFEEKPA